MIKIECDVWQQSQLIEYLDYSAKKLQEDFNNDKITLECLIYEQSKINNLKKIVNGKEYDGYLLKCKSARRKHYVFDELNDDKLNDAEKEIMKLPYQW